MKGQATDSEKIFAKNTSHKELVLKTCQEVLKLDNKETTQFKSGQNT